MTSISDYFITNSLLGLVKNYGDNSTFIRFLDYLICMFTRLLLRTHHVLIMPYRNDIVIIILGMATYNVVLVIDPLLCIFRAFLFSCCWHFPCKRRF